MAQHGEEWEEMTQVHPVDSLSQVDGAGISRNQGWAEFTKQNIGVRRATKSEQSTVLLPTVFS